MAHIESGDGEHALVAAAQRGDRGALEQLLRLHHDRIYALCRRIAGNEADGADACQEALIAIVRGLARFDGRSSFATWAYRVSTNACLDELRRRRRRPALVLDDGDGHAFEHPNVSPDGASHGQSFESAITDRMILDAALARLPEEFRVPVVLRDVVGLDYAQIAEALDIPAGTVRSRIARGRASLARILGNLASATERPIPEP